MFKTHADNDRPKGRLLFGRDLDEHVVINM